MFYFSFLLKLLLLIFISLWYFPLFPYYFMKRNQTLELKVAIKVIFSLFFILLSFLICFLSFLLLFFLSLCFLSPIFPLYNFIVERHILLKKMKNNHRKKLLWKLLSFVYLSLFFLFIQFVLDFLTFSWFNTSLIVKIFIRSTKM